MNTKIYSRYLHWEEYLNFKIYIFLIIFCIFAESVIADDFVELKPVLVEGRVDLGNTLKGKEYFFLLEIPDVKGPEISKVSTSCACLQILEYTKEKAAGNFRVSLVYIPVKNGSFKTSLDLDLEGGIQKKVVLHSEVLGDDAKTVTVGLENKLLKRELVSYNKKLYVDLNKVLTSSQKFTFIDIRDRKSYSQLRIPESLNLQPSDLLSSPFF
ncbi:MAG: hypothetical protein NE328_19425, partial [Lentisphaeraceae bacterium]|nr:hypothetical protein [Lentisphaeraceae bacterium]